MFRSNLPSQMKTQTGSTDRPHYLASFATLAREYSTGERRSRAKGAKDAREGSNRAGLSRDPSARTYPVKRRSESGVRSLEMTTSVGGMAGWVKEWVSVPQGRPKAANPGLNYSTPLAFLFARRHSER